MPTDELTTRLAAVYAQCLMAAATMSAAHNAVVTYEDRSVSFDAEQQADIWFRRAVQEAGIAAMDFEETIRECSRERTRRRQENDRLMAEIEAGAMSS